MNRNHEPIKICLVVSDFSPKVGGISTFTTGLATALSLNPDVAHVRVIVLRGQAHEVEKVSDKLTVRRMPRGSVWRTFWTLVRELWRSRDYDVFHSPNVFPVGFCTLLIGKYFLRKPVIGTSFGTDVLTHEGSAATQFAKGFMLRHATAMTVISKSTGVLIAARYHIPVEHFSVVYYPLPPHIPSTPIVPIRSAYHYTPEDIIVMTVAHLVRRKGVVDLIRSLTFVSNKNIKLLVVGDGPERAALEALSQKLELADRVQFAGRVADVDSFYHHADIFALTSYYIKEEGDVEGLGIVFLEAEQHGIPVIGTRSGGIPETMLEGETGLLVAERDVIALAEKIETLANDAQMRKAMGEKGQAFVKKRFDIRAIAQEYVTMYRKYQ